jgi:hypothetical protein
MSQAKVDPLALCMEQLSQALAAELPGRERHWAESVGIAVTRVETALRQYRTSGKKPDGVLAEVDETRPTLARQAGELRGTLDEILAQTSALREQVQRAAEAFRPGAGAPAGSSNAGVVDFGAIRQEAEKLLANLEEIRKTEMKLVLESVNTDIGVCD